MLCVKRELEWRCLPPPLWDTALLIRLCRSRRYVCLSVCLSVPASSSVSCYCYGREHKRRRRAEDRNLHSFGESWTTRFLRPEANKVWGKQAAGCLACLCQSSLARDQVEVYSQPLPSACQLYNRWLFLFKYKPETYSNVSSPWKTRCYFFPPPGSVLRDDFSAVMLAPVAADRHLSRTLLHFGRDVHHLLSILRVPLACHLNKLWFMYTFDFLTAVPSTLTLFLASSDVRRNDCR